MSTTLTCPFSRHKAADDTDGKHRTANTTPQIVNCRFVVTDVTKGNAVIDHRQHLLHDNNAVIDHRQHLLHDNNAVTDHRQHLLHDNLA